MRTKQQLYLKILMGVSGLAMVFHLLILLKFIPYDITWGGRLKSDTEMYVFEAISLVINSFFVYVLLQKGNFVRPFFGAKTVSTMLWIFFAVFVLNTLGNIFAETTFEKGFTVVTLVNAVLLWLVNRR